MCLIGRDHSDDGPPIRKTVEYIERPERASRVSQAGSRRGSRVYVERDVRNSNGRRSYVEEVRTSQPAVVYEKRTERRSGNNIAYEERYDDRRSSRDYRDRDREYDREYEYRESSGRGGNRVVYEERHSRDYQPNVQYQTRRSRDVIVEPEMIVKETRRII